MRVRRRLEPVERALPVTLPGSQAAAARSASPEPDRGAPAPQDAAARIDAARERLRATIEPPDDRGAHGA